MAVQGGGRLFLSILIFGFMVSHLRIAQTMPAPELSFLPNSKKRANERDHCYLGIWRWPLNGAKLLSSFARGEVAQSDYRTENLLHPPFSLGRSCILLPLAVDDALQKNKYFGVKTRT